MKRTCRNLSEEHKKKIGLGNKGKKRSDEVLEWHPIRE